MKDKKLIIEISNKLNDLLENAPTEDEIDDNNLIEFYANAQNLKESISQLRNSKNGLYPDEVMELMNYIQENNSWENLYKCYKRGREAPKYYTMRVDTRTGTVWSITFDNLRYDKTEKSFRTEQTYNFKNAIYEFLDKERKNEND